MENNITVTITTKQKLTAEDVAGMLASKDNVNKRRKLPEGGVYNVSVVEVKEAKAPAKKAAPKKAAPKKADEKVEDAPETKDENDGTDTEV